MKKHNEGYTLALVLVVLTVLCILSSAVMTYAVKNLKNQQEAAQRDQNRYTAEGVVEESLGKLQAFAEKNKGITLLATFDNSKGIFLLQPQVESQAEDQDDTAEKNEVIISGVEAVHLEAGELIADGLNLTLISVCESTRIECTLRLMATVESRDEGKLYALTNFTGVECASYAMSIVATGGEGNAQPEE